MKAIRPVKGIVALFMCAVWTLPALASFRGTDVFLPMVGRRPGIHPSNWYTKVWVFNPNGTAVDVTIYLLERSTSNPDPPFYTDTVQAGDTRLYENAVFTLFGVEVYGAMRVVATDKVVVSCRVYSQATGLGEEDSVGQFFAGVPASYAIGVGETSEILGVHQTVPTGESEFRYNFGFVETTGNNATVRVTAWDETGAMQGQKDFQVREWSQRQVAFKDHFPAVSTENSRLTVEVVAGTGKIIAYGSGIANGSQDPSTFEMTYPELPVVSDATLVGDGTEQSPLGLADGAVTLEKLGTLNSPLAPSGEGEQAQAAPPVTVLTSDGWDIWWDTAGKGGITSVTAGDGLTGGGVEDDVTLAVGAGPGIDVQADAVGIAAGGVGTEMLAIGAVTTAAIAPDAVTSGKIQDGQVMAVDVADNAVSSAKLQDGAVTSTKILDGAVAGADLADASVTSAKLADDAVSASKIANGSVTTAKIADSAVTRAKLADSSVASPEISDGSVGPQDLADGAVTLAKIDTSGGTSGQVLRADSPATWGNDGLTLPFEGSTVNGGGGAIKVTNTANGALSFGIEGWGKEAGGYFHDTNESGHAWVGYGDYGIEARGTHAGRFHATNGSGGATIAYGDYGIGASGDKYAGYFVGSHFNTHAYLAYGEHGFGVEAEGNEAGGYFKDKDHSGIAYVGYGNRGVEAWGNEMGGYFQDANESGWAKVGTGNTGINAQGNAAGGRFKDLNQSGNAYVGHGDRGITAEGTAEGGHFTDSDGSGLAIAGVGDTGIHAVGNGTGGYFADSNNSGYAWAGYGNTGIKAGGTTYAGDFQGNVRATGTMTWSPNLISYSAATSSTSPSCSAYTSRTFCSLAAVSHRYFHNDGTWVACSVEVTSSGWRICARGNGTTEASCTMFCF